MLQHGSSDPFNCQPIIISPRILQILNFAQNVEHALSVMPYMRRLLRDVSGCKHDFVGTLLKAQRKLNWEFTAGSEASMSALISLYSPSMAFFLPDHEQKELALMSLQYRTRSISSLRQVLSALKVSQQPDICSVMACQRLFRIHTFKNDIKQAKIHAKMTSNLASGILNNHQRAHFVYIAVFNDIVAATVHLRRPLLDYGGWLQEVISLVYPYVSDILPAEISVDDEDHNELMPLTLRRFCTRLRWYLCFSKRGIIGRVYDPVMLHKYIMLSAWRELAALLEFYAEVTSLIQPDLLNAALVLTAIMVFQKSIFLGLLHGDDFLDSSRSVLPPLKRTVQELLRAAGMYSSRARREAIAWILFNGAQLEHSRYGTSHNRRHVLEGLTVEPFWFSRTLAKHARQLGVESWLEARAVLDKFIYDEFSEPAPWEWYESCTSTV